MKKIIIITILFALVVSSCRRGKVFPFPKDTTTFYAVIEEVTTKTVIKGKTVKWKGGEEIAINGSVIFISTPSSSDSTEASFTKKDSGQPDPESPFSVIYPTSLYHSDGYSLPAVWTYSPDSFDVLMFAYSTSKTLEFKNIFAVLKVTVPSSVTIKKIVVTSDLVMNGDFTINEYSAVMTKTEEITVDDRTFTLDCGAGVAGTVFYIPVPPASYTGKNLMVTIVKGNGSSEYMLTKETATVELERNTLYSFDFSGNVLPVFPTVTEEVIQL